MPPAAPALAPAPRGDVGRLAQGLRQPPNVALQHVHPAHFIHRTPAHLRQRLEHQAFAHPVAHLADQHLGRVFRLKRRHPREKRAKPFELAFARAAPFDVGYFFEAALTSVSVSVGGGSSGRKRISISIASPKSAAAVKMSSL